uniref:Secreted protein n=1 Tax=Mycena chlorophos TaxID=658473 RepID=A0ABQ0LY48_MYCCL|nr:predicted protein [Mycena chlorophos]
MFVSNSAKRFFWLTINILRVHVSASRCHVPQPSVAVGVKLVNAAAKTHKTNRADLHGSDDTPSKDSIRLRHPVDAQHINTLVRPARQHRSQEPIRVQPLLAAPLKQLRNTRKLRVCAILDFALGPRHEHVEEV